MRHERSWEPLTQPGPAANSVPPTGGHRLPGGDLEADWRRLESAASLPSQTFDFHAALAEAMTVDRLREVVTVRDGEETVALLPLCRRHGWSAGWHAAGPRQVFEPADALCRDRIAARKLAERLAGLSRPLKLDRIPAASLLVDALKTAIKGRGLIALRPAQGSPRIDFAADEPDPEMRFNSGRRSDFRRARRRAEALGAVTFEVRSPTPDEFDDLLREAIAIEQSGWKGDAGTALGSDAAKAAFFRMFLKAASRDGRCRIAFMRIAGQAVAMQLAVEFQQRYWLFKIGFDQQFSRCSPGNLLLLHAMSDAAARGLKGVELLGEVEPWIVEAWTRDATECLRVQTYPFNLRGLAALVKEGARWARHRLPLARQPA